MRRGSGISSQEGAMEKMNRRKGNRPEVKDLTVHDTKELKGGATVTRFDPYRNFKFRITN
jgi:hypothetical protein